MYILTHPWLIGHGIVRERLKETFDRSFKNKIKQPNKIIVPNRIRPYGILAIAVDPNVQGKGVGKLLMNEEELQAKKLGFQQMGLTVSPKNMQAIQFYEGLGWQKVFTENQEWKGRMVKNLGDSIP